MTLSLSFLIITGAEGKAVFAIPVDQGRCCADFSLVEMLWLLYLNTSFLFDP